MYVRGYGGPSLLYHNNGDGTFSKITNGMLVSFLPAEGDGSLPCWADYDGDGFLDVFIHNIGDKNQLFHNNRDGTFTEITEGPVVNDSGNANGGGVAWGDYDNDGFLDLFVSDWGTGKGGFVNYLYHNNGDGTFTKVTKGNIVTDLGSSSSATWADFDNDGNLDLFVARDSAQGAPNSRSLLYRNNGDGTFTSITTGDPVNDSGFCLSAACGDYDKDGFLDLFVSNYNRPPFLYRNNGNSNNWIELHLVGRVSNRSAIGAKVRVKATIRGKTYWQMREITNGDGLSGNSLDPHFGLGDATNIDTVRIEWPSGLVQELRNVAAKQFLTVTEPPRLSGMTRKADGSAQLNVSEWPGMSARVDFSTDLVNWTPLMTVTNKARVETIMDPTAKNSATRFYRAVGQ